MSGIDILSGRQVLAPNVWARGTEVFDATVRVVHAPASEDSRSAANRIDAVLPLRRDLFSRFEAAAGEPARDPVPWLRLLGQVALTLQSHARLPATRLLSTGPADGDGLFRVVIEAHDPLLAEECLRAASRLLDGALAGDLADPSAMLDRLRERADDVCVGPSTMLIVDAAVARGIPWRRLGRECLVQLGHGIRQRRIWTAETDRTSAIAEQISRDKQLTKQLLKAAGVPVPIGRAVSSADEAWEAAQAVGVPVVVKPLDANHGRGVFLDLSGREEIERACAVAMEEGRRTRTVVVEEFVSGLEHRLLVIGGRMTACAKGEHVHVTGDGRHTIAELIGLQINSDPRRGRSEAMPNKTVDIDATVLAELSHQGVTPETVPAAGSRVLVRQIGTHGLDVTSSVHPEMAALAVRAARAVGLDVAGIDLIARDITRPPGEQGAKVCEVNAGPQLIIHSNPSRGPGQPVGMAIVDELFAPGDDGRIPVVLLAGDGMAATALALHELLLAAGRTPGLSCSAGHWLGGLECSREPCPTTDAARDLLVSPEIDSAVCELDWRSIAARGMPVDRCDVLVLGRLPADGPTRGGADPRPAVLATLVDSVADAGTIVLGDVDHEFVELARSGGLDLPAIAAAGGPPGDRRGPRWIATGGGPTRAADTEAVIASPTADGAAGGTAAALAAAALGVGDGARGTPRGPAGPAVARDGVVGRADPRGG